ncbi:alternative ribosome rescue aminoacyl-tRNA hydrolase ArfB [uncultured Desulfobulbus sp.]|uniref:alternative ribosome rescue aminoacyl-tRNA hydrolase ArfB n=1 Tax=uncultured Desulfobulbus sp. TaxID=239745 RepID=UPI00261251E2|nr:alternative ribosome rescue aminoacyl-tRNA hydrolase ArfB [uncultured Desulfobulbus sp.]
MAEIRFTPTLAIDEREIEWSAIRAQGPGGQNVNKVANAALLRFDVRASSLPEACKAALLARRDRRLTADGVLVIRAEEFRSLEQNRVAALARLTELVVAAATPRRRRRATRPTRGSVQRRLDTKTRRSRTKALRRKPE